MSAHTTPFDLFKGPTSIVDPGNGKAINVERSPCVVPITTAAAETRTVPNPTKAGAFLTLAMKVDGGDCVVTFATAYNEAGDTTFTFNDPGQIALFQSVEISTSVIAWRLLATYGTGNANANAVAGVGAGYKIARGQATTVAASDTIVTGLATVVSAVANLEDAPVIGCDRAQANIGDQAGTPAAGSILIKTFKPTASGDATPVAATTFTKKVNWIAIGT